MFTDNVYQYITAEKFQQILFKILYIQKYSIPVYAYTGIPIYWYTGILVYWYTDDKKLK